MLKLDRAKLSLIKKELFDPNRQGYFLIENYLSTSEVQIALAEYKQSLIDSKPFPGSNFIYKGCPTYLSSVGGKKTSYFFPWTNDQKYKKLTEIFDIIHRLRDELEGSRYWRNIDRICTMRVVESRNHYEDIPVHSDHIDSTNENQRLQCSISLSQIGRDYPLGTGIYFESDGHRIFPFEHVKSSVGALLIFRYAKPHGVIESFESDINQTGFLRILFPESQLNKIPNFFIRIINLIKSTLN